YRRSTSASHADSLARPDAPGLPAWDDRAERQGRERLERQDLDRARWQVLALQMETEADLAGLKAALDELGQKPDEPGRWKKFAAALASEWSRARPAKN